MQPTMVITAPEGGMVYINGRFAGETDVQHPLMRPTNPTGAIYIEYRPFSSSLRSLARRLVFSGGAPMAESAEAAEDIRIVSWPGQITEIEIIPPQARPAAPISFEAGGRQLIIDSGRLLTAEGQSLSTLPEGAQIPQYQLMTHGAALLGNCASGMYLITGDGQFGQVSGYLEGSQIELAPDGRIQALIRRNDLVGHASIESWRLGSEGLTMVSSESAWADGAPKWPQTAAQTVQAAIEAELAGLPGEAEGYLSPALHQSSPLAQLAERCDLCTQMKYALPEERPCVALIRLENGNMAKVEPLYYRASPSGGAQGPYQIDLLELG